MSIFWYRLLIIVFAVTTAILFDIYVYSRGIKRFLKEDDSGSWTIINGIILPIFLDSLVGIATLLTTINYLPSPTVYQIDSTSSTPKTYIVDDYSSIGGISFKCGSSTIHLGDAEVKEIPRSQPIPLTTKICNL